MQFQTGPAISMSYDDLKLIEATEFLKSIVSEKQGEPGFKEALAVAEVQEAMKKSWESRKWEEVVSLRKS